MYMLIQPSLKIYLISKISEKNIFKHCHWELTVFFLWFWKNLRSELKKITARSQNHIWIHDNVICWNVAQLHFRRLSPKKECGWRHHFIVPGLTTALMGQTEVGLIFSVLHDMQCCWITNNFFFIWNCTRGLLFILLQHWCEKLKFWQTFVDRNILTNGNSTVSLFTFQFYSTYNVAESPIIFQFFGNCHY